MIIDAHSHYMPPEVAAHTAFFKEHWSDLGTQLRLMDPTAVADMVSFALSVPANACPLELAVINQLTTWTKPVIDYKQTQAK